MKKNLDKRQQEMLAAKTAAKAAADAGDDVRNYNRDAKRRERLRKQLTTMGATKVRVEVVDSETTVMDVVGKLQEALQTFEGMTPEAIHSKVTSLTQLLHVKLQLHASACLDQMASGDPDVRQDAIKMLEVVMPFITQITELNLKMQAVLGLAENKGKLTGVQRRQVAAPSASPDEWEKSFSDTLTNKALN